MLKKGIYKTLSVFCAAVISMSFLSLSRVSADEPVGKMSAVYAYVLNDYLYSYGSLHTENAGDTIRDETAHGIVYSDVVNFDNNDNPYLVIFLSDANIPAASCHIWKYNESKEIAERIAVLDVNYNYFAEGQGGLFLLGSNNNTRYIMYSSLENGEPAHTDYYTVVKGDAFEYVNAPVVLSESGVMDFGADYFHADVDISNYNQNIGEFFDNLKNSAADSVTYEDISERLKDEDEAQMEMVLRNVVGFTDFDIANYSSIDAYRNALTEQSGRGNDKFYLISEAYNLGDEIYYIRFSTDRTYYNYALLRRSDDAENGYQILKVRTDCIPLSDRELRQIKTDYDRNTLLYKKSKGSLSLLKHSKYSAEETMSPIKFEKSIDSKTHLPIVCIGGGIAIALLTILWVYLYSDND